MQAWCEDRLLIPGVGEARGAWGRFLGLMGRRGLPEGRALLLRPCDGIHTLFMRFPIDAIFLDAEDRVLRVARGVRPWRPAVAVRGARAVIEMRSGWLPPDTPARGARLSWRDATGAEIHPIPDRRVFRKAAQWIVPLTVVLLIAVVLAAFLQHRALELRRVLFDVRYQWYELVEPNILNLHLRTALNNPGIVVPTTAEGILLTDRIPTDLHVDLDRNGHVYIANARLSPGAYSALFSGHIRRHGQVRVFIRADTNAPSASRSRLIDALREAGDVSLYYVGAAASSPGARIQHLAIPIPARDAPRVDR